MGEAVQKNRHASPLNTSSRIKGEKNMAKENTDANVCQAKTADENL